MQYSQENTCGGFIKNNICKSTYFEEHLWMAASVLIIIELVIKGNVQFVQKMTFEPLMDFKQNHYASWKYYKSGYFKSFLHLSYKNIPLLFLWQCFLIFFMRKKLTNDFCGFHKNMNCLFLLSIVHLVHLLSSPSTSWLIWATFHTAGVHFCFIKISLC